MTLTLDLPDELLLRGDRVYLTQLLTNLVENALKHGAGVCTRVCITGGRIYEQDRAEIRLRVVDDGPGIAATHLSHLGERFYRADRARTHNTDSRSGGDADGSSGTGSGLGLAIAHWIARAHGGSLQIESEEGHGATFEVRLPCSGQRPRPRNNHRVAAIDDPRLG